MNESEWRFDAGYDQLKNALKAIALTVPAARAFEMTVEFVLGEGQDTATVGRLEDHFRDCPPMEARLERMRADPATRKCIEDRDMGLELDLDQLIHVPRGSLGSVYAKVVKRLGYAAHFDGVRPSIEAETDDVTMRVRKTHDFHHVVTGFSMIGPGELGVIAITALRYGCPGFMTIDLGAIALSMMRVEGRGEPIHSVPRGWDMAERIKPPMGVRWRWEEGLDKPLDVWRGELGIEPVRAGPISWYEVLADLKL